MMRGMGNMQGMMKQMQKLQKEMEKSQAELNDMVFEGAAANELVTISMNGKREVLDIRLKPEVVDPDDVDMLQDLLVMAVNDVLAKVEKTTNQVMGKYTRGLPF